MMKVTVGLLVFYLALCQATPGWKEGKEYIYSYEAKYGTGISDNVVTQFAGRGIRAKIHVYYKDNELALKITDLKGAEFNTKMGNVFEVLELDYKQSDKVPAEVREEVSKPYWGEYHDGRITALKHTGPKAPEYINRKRAILSLFQVILPIDEHEHYYNVNESSIGGDCETTYVISHLPRDENPDAQVINITKNHWYDKCTYRPHQFFSSANGYKCTHCHEEDFKRFQDILRIDYGIRGNRKEYTIEYIYATGGLTYSPFSTNGQTVISLTNQTLYLEEIKDAEYPAAPGDAHRDEGLYYVTENYDLDNLDLKENHYYFSGTYKPDTKRIDKAEVLFNKLDTSDTLARDIIDLVYIFETFNYEDYINFFSRNIILNEDASPAEKVRRNLVLNALPLSGNSPTILYALELIEHDKIESRIGNQILAEFPFYAKTPSLALLKRYYEFVKSDKVNAVINKSIHSVAWLSFGTLLFKSCVKDDFNAHPPHRETYVSHDKCIPFIQDIIKRLESSKTNEEKCVYLRALKNTRTHEAFEYLVKEIIPVEKKHSYYLRLTAIWGMEHYVEEHNDEVVEVVVPIVTDPNEHYLLRIYAFDILLYTEPHPVTFANTVLGVNKDPNEKFATYVYSTLSNIANATDPCLERMAKNARYVLPLIRNRGGDVVRHSTNRIYSFYNEKYGFGRTSQLINIPSYETLFPRGLYMRQAVNIGGYNFDFSEIGGIQFDSHSWDVALAYLLQKYGVLNKVEDSKIEKHVKPPKEDYPANHEFYARIFNQDLIVNHGDFDLGHNPYITKVSEQKYDVRYSRVIAPFQVEHIVPNAIGLPVMLSLQTPFVAKVEGTAGLTDKTNLGLAVEYDLKVSFNTENMGQIEVSSPLFGQYGYRLRTDAGVTAPIKGSFSFDFATHKVKLTEEIPEKPYEFLHYDSVPSTFVNDVELPVRYSEKPITKQYKWGHNYFGAGYRAELTYDYRWDDYGSYRTFFESFFHKSTRYEDYYSFAENLYAGTQGFLDYANLNPTAKPFHLSVKYERATQHPATEYVYEWKREESRYYDEAKTEGDQLISNRKIELEITGKGPVERKWNLAIDVDRHWPVNDERKLNLHYKRSALPDYDDKTYEACLETHTKIKGFDAIIKNPLTANFGGGIDYKAELHVGETCKASDARQITITGEGRPSEEHKEVDTAKLPIYQKCKQDFEKGYELSYACWQVRRDQGRLGHYVFNIEFSKNVNPKVKELLYRIYDWVRSTFYNNLQIDHVPNSDIGEDHLKVVVNASYRYPVADVHVYRPTETVHYHNIFIPSVFTCYEPITITDSLVDRVLRGSIGYHTPFCKLSGDYVRTLDGVDYKYALGPCYHVAIANTESYSLGVFFKTVEDGKYNKAMKVIVDKDELEIIPEGGKLVVKDNGKQILEDETAHKFHSVDGVTVTGAVYKKLEGYEVDAPYHGLRVYFDGKNAFIKLSNIHRGHQHGLCGDFDGERHHEFKGNEGKLYLDAIEFARSYAVHEDGCHA